MKLKNVNQLVTKIESESDKFGLRLEHYQIININESHTKILVTLQEYHPDETK